MLEAINRDVEHGAEHTEREEEEKDEEDLCVHLSFNARLLILSTHLVEHDLCVVACVQYKADAPRCVA